MDVALYCDASKSDWKTDARHPGDKYYCIAGILVPKDAEADLDREMKALKRRSFLFSKDPKLLEIKGSDFARRSGIFRKFSDQQRDAFSQELTHIVFEKLCLKVLAICDVESKFELREPKMLTHKLKLGASELAYLFFLTHYCAYLKKMGLTGQVVFDKENDNFGRLLEWMKTGEQERAFDISSCIDLQSDTSRFFVDSKQSNVMQIADVCAYTLGFFYAMTHMEKNGRMSVLPAHRLNRLIERKCPVRIETFMDACVEEPFIVANVLPLSLNM